MTDKKLTERVYGYLAEDEDARVCKDIPESACNEQPRSFVLMLLSLMLTKLGDSLVSARLVLPWMLSSLGAPAIFISALVPLRESLALLPQLFVAQKLREQPVRKWFWVAGSIGQALSLLAMLFAVATLDGDMLGWSVVILLALFSLSRGICSVANKDVTGKTVSKTRRGRMSGVAASAAGLLTLLTALVIIFAPEMDGQRPLFVALLGAGVVLWVVAALLYAGIPEVAGATEGGGNALTEAVKSMSLLWQNRQFGHFVVSRALLVAAAFAIPYIVVLIQREGEAELTSLGSLMLASGLAGLLAGRFWGRWSDSASHHVMAAASVISTLVMGIALALYYWAPDALGMQWVAAALLFSSAVAHHGARVGRKTYLVDMATQDNRAQLTAVSNTVMGVVLLAGLLLGWVDAAYGVAAVLWVLAAIGVIATFSALRLPDVSG
ncbi:MULTISPECIES: MFS transporter [Idiomarina]|jgi:predicted MFS family arabinose efflux permease|uniref:MFS transporter n=1 Tax=Idiomarina TaxID=135575 RepID=UPI000C425BC4|nr:MULTISPECIES: MFS transporter [Idiomarina]MAO68517.1 MFS transporter permease [Idiomarina sp.]MBF79229.1 MFS transporter permease [Idiomarina sp.]|tara:strand:+ start:22014 stop:23327 length:1314 start_codon:yes stop_codon:yes gene_type:complete